jgi:hypothetical protein
MANSVYILERKIKNGFDDSKELLVYSNRDLLLKAMKNMYEQDKKNNPYMNNLADLIEEDFCYSISNWYDCIIVHATEKEMDSKFI